MRTQISFTALTLTIALSLVSQAVAGPKDEVAAAAKQWAAAFSEHNVERILALYSRDALLWGTTSSELRTDPASVRDYFVAAFKIPNIKISYDNQTIRVFDNNVAVVAGNYTFIASGSGETQTRPARYSFTFIKNGDKWLIIDHNSSPMPPRRTGRIFADCGSPDFSGRCDNT